MRARLVPIAGTLAIVALLAACSAAPGSPAPVAGGPSIQPSPPPTAAPVTILRVDLQSTSGQDVTIDILDRSRSVTSATSGKPGEGVSFDSDSVVVENIGPRTLRLGWSDFPIDNELQLHVDPVGVGYRFLLIQPAPTGPADAMGEDRILEVTFDRDISAAEVEAFLQEGLDVPG